MLIKTNTTIKPKLLKDLMLGESFVLTDIGPNTIYIKINDKYDAPYANARSLDNRAAKYIAKNEKVYSVFIKEATIEFQ